MRLFVAINLPAAEKLRLSAILDELRRTNLPFRWADSESLHITMKFLGEVAEQQLTAAVAAVRQAVRDVAPFDIEIGGVGAFPALARPRILWIGVDRSAALLHAQHAVEEEFARIGMEREDRPFHAHLTLGRLKRTSERPDPVELDRMTSLIVYKAVVRVESIDLMRSHLGSGGARYETLERATLKN